MKTFKEFQESYLKTAVKIAAPFVGLGLLGQLGKKNPLQKRRDEVQTNKQKKYEKLKKNFKKRWRNHSTSWKPR